MLALVLGAAILGCGGMPIDPQMPVSRSRSYARTIDTLGAAMPVPAPPDEAWRLLPGVFADLGLEVNFREPAALRTGTCHQSLRSRLGRERLSAFLDCGATQAVPSADTYDVTLTVLTTVLPRAGGGSTLHTFVMAVAVGGGGASGHRVWCQSTGRLEARIRDGVRTRASG
jgi:hypothetical protein